MADAQLKLSRRALLGAVCSAPLAATPAPVRSERSRGPLPSAAKARQSAWTHALARFRSAEATLAALEGHPDEAAFGSAHDRFNHALRCLLAQPAPDLPALATKLEIADQAELADLTFAPPALAALATDARRLAAID
jgi:hypothetical protein